MTQTEAQLTLPRGPVLAALAVTTLVCAGAAIGCARWAADPRQATIGALAGVALVGVLFLAGAFIVASGKPRPVSLLPALWMGATIARVMGLLVAVFPIYFAAPQFLPSIAVGAAGAYLACLTVETAMLARQALRL